ncbi:MAG: FAD-dependent oxidoreductase [Planctomycetes bacterium]|nr:FAD-dependent oxidoreductase [Planctomycetota bacterium]
MKPHFTRRDLMKVLSAAGFGTLISSTVRADAPTGAAAAGPAPAAAGASAPAAGSATFCGQVIAPTVPPHAPAALVGGQVVQPQRTLPVLHQADVLVVGGGSAGVMAAIAARRAGAKTAIIERYGYFGGLWTGGMVLLVIGTHVKDGAGKKKVVRGLGDELLERLKKIDGAIINQDPGAHNPTADPEATKFIMDEMVREAGVDVFFHCWGADAVMDGKTIRGVVFESKAGRQAILAKVVVDATGDGDIFAAAGAEYVQRTYAIGTVHRHGNMDRIEKGKAPAGTKLPPLGGVTPLPSLTWVNTRGPKENGLDVAALSRLEMDHRRDIWNRLRQIKQTPGYESIFIADTAPQLGVRITRVLVGTCTLTYQEMRAGKKFPDVVAVGGAQGANHAGWPIPYGVLVPKEIDNLLTAGRSVSADEKLLDDTRLIAACLTTGHAAGAAAAVAAQSGCRPRDVDIAKVQELLTEQGAYLG